MSLVLQYHEIRGRAAPIRMMLEYAKFPYTNKYAGDWFTSGKADAAKVNALANLPIIFDGDTVVTQSSAVTAYVAEKVGLNGRTETERINIDQAICQVQDWVDTATSHFYGPRTATYFEDHAKRIRSHYEKFENLFKRTGFLFTAANRPTAGDFQLWEVLDAHEWFARAFNKPSFLTQYPFLYAFYGRFFVLPQLQDYFSGPLFALSFNAPLYASFGFDPDATKLRPVEGESPSDKIEIGYWKIRGLAAPLRMMASFAKADFESVEYLCDGKKSTGYDRSGWSEVAKPPLRELNPLMNLPYVKCGQDLVTQSNACVLYLARKFGLLGSSLAEQAKVQQVMWQTTDLRNKAVGRFYNGDQSKGAAEKYLGQIAVHYKKLEAWFQQHGTDYSAGSSITASDFHLFEMLDQHEEYVRAVQLPSQFADGAYPALAAFYKRFGEHPGNQAYFQSRLHKLPINNRTAGFGPHEDYSSLNHYNKL